MTKDGRKRLTQTFEQPKVSEVETLRAEIAALTAKLLAAPVVKVGK